MTVSVVDAIAFGSWAQRLGRTPTPEEIKARYPEMSRSCVYRWRQYLLDAWGIPPTGSYLKTSPAPGLAHRIGAIQ